MADRFQTAEMFGGIDRLRRVDDLAIVIGLCVVAG
jgi:hypothetical protein